MNAAKSPRMDLFDRVLRGMLAMALLAGVAWALTDGGAAPAVAFAALRN